MLNDKQKTEIARALVKSFRYCMEEMEVMNEGGIEAVRENDIDALVDDFIGELENLDFIEKMNEPKE